MTKFTYLWDGRYGRKICFYDDVPEILHKIQSQSEGIIEGSKVIIAACSRTHAPDL